MQGLDTMLALTTTVTTVKTKNASIDQIGEIRCGGIARYGKVMIDMRLIDADALIQKANYEADGMTEPFKSQIGVLVEWLVDKTPTIEPERKTGKWIVLKHTKHAMCSECRRSFIDVYDLENWDHYCRHCGTVMESIVAEEE